MINKILEQTGLNKNEAITYLALLKSWTDMVWNIIRKTNLPRATVYDSLERLLKKTVISKSSKQWTVSYTAEPPQVLQYLLEKKKDEIWYVENSLNKILPELKSLYNPYSILPWIKFYEWIEWIEKVLNDSLTSTEVIYTYVNVDWMDKYIKEINDKYLENRKKMKVFKKWLVLKTPYAEKLTKWYDKSVTETRLLDKKYFFSLECEIYDSKVSFITYTNDKPVWIIIENKEIYQMHRSLFELNWENAEIIK